MADKSVDRKALALEYEIALNKFCIASGERKSSNSAWERYKDARGEFLVVAVKVGKEYLAMMKEAAPNVPDGVLENDMAGDKRHAATAGDTVPVSPAGSERAKAGKA